MSERRLPLPPFVHRPRPLSIDDLDLMLRGKASCLVEAISDRGYGRTSREGYSGRRLQAMAELFLPDRDRAPGDLPGIDYIAVALFMGSRAWAIRWARRWLKIDEGALYGLED